MVRDGSNAQPTPLRLFSREFRLFISSTFRDMQAEREQLVKRVFPELDQTCRLRGVSFAEVDLRWGITQYQSSNGEVTRTCLDEITIKRPFLIGIIGSQYGWIPPLNELQQPDLLDRFPELGSAQNDRRSIVEIEIIEGVLNNPLMEGRALFYFRDPSSDSGRRSRESKDAKLRLERLKDRIRGSGFPVRENYRDAQSFAQMVLKDLRDLIEEHYPVDVSLTPLEIERRAHEAFAATRRRAYVEVPAYLEQLDEYVEGAVVEGSGDTHLYPSAAPIVVTGESGAGKSALLAYWSRRYRDRHPDAFLIEHYVGATSAATDHITVLRHVMAEIKARYQLTDEVPTKAEEIEQALPHWLAHVQRETLVVIVDALNQLEERSQSLHWLPYLQPRVRMIASTLEGGALDELSERGWRQLRVKPLTRQQRRHVVKEFLAQYGKRLSGEQLRRIADERPSANPLFLRTLLEELRVFGSFERLDEKIGQLKTDDLGGLFEQVLERLERVYGTKLATEILALIWASRHGLSEAELLALSPFPANEIARLLLALEYHLINRDRLYAFFHDHLRRAVEKRYIGEPDGTVSRKYHRRIAKHFAAQPISPRRADEEPWQWTQAHEWKRLKECIAAIPMFLELCGEERKYELMRYWRLLPGHPRMDSEYRSSLTSLSSEAHEAIDIIRTRRAVGDFFAVAGDFFEAHRLLAETLESVERIQTSRSELASILQSLAAVEKELGKYSEAGLHLQRALDIIANLKEGEQSTGKILDELAAVNYWTSDVEQARRFATESLARNGQKGTSNSPEVAIGLNNLGAILAKAEDYDGALALFLQSQEIAKRTLGDRHPKIAEILNNIGAIYQKKNLIEQAANWFERARSISEEVLGPRHPDTATYIHNFALTLKIQERVDDAERLYRESLAINLQCFGPSHPRVANAQQSLAVLLREKRKDYAQAERLLTHAYSIWESIFSADHIDTVMCGLNLGSLHKEQYNFETALPFYEENVPRLVRCLGQKHRLSIHAANSRDEVRQRLSCNDNESTAD